MRGAMLGIPLPRGTGDPVQIARRADAKNDRVEALGRGGFLLEEPT
jgi:hypothetical protein